MHNYKVELESQPDAAIPGVMRCIRKAKDRFDAVAKAREGAGMAYQNGPARCEKVKAVEREAATDEMIEFIHEGFGNGAA